MWDPTPAFECDRLKTDGYLSYKKRGVNGYITPMIDKNSQFDRDA